MTNDPEAAVPKGSNLTGLQRWSLLPPLVVASVGLLATLGTWRVLLALEDRVVASRLQFDAQERQIAIEQEIQDSLGSLVFLSSLFAVHPEVTREDFQTFTRPILALRPVAPIRSDKGRPLDSIRPPPGCCITSPDAMTKQGPNSQ